MQPHRPRRGPRRLPRSIAQAEPVPTPAPKITPEPEAAATSAAWLDQIGKVLGAIVAPTTLSTALLYYFGWNHAFWFFNYFGVNSTTLGFTSVDYLMRSVDALFVPLTEGAIIGLLLLWGHAELHSHITARPRAFGIILACLALIGLVLAVGGLVSIFRNTVLSDHLTAAPLSLASGILLLTYANRQRRTAPRKRAAVAEWSVVFILVAISLFWAATDYSAAVGTSRAHHLLQQLPSYPTVLLYSSKSLNLNAPGIHETRCHDQQGAYPYRYDGLKLVLQSGGQYLFLPQKWSRNSTAVLLPRSDALRLEFAPALTQTPPTC